MKKRNVFLLGAIIAALLVVCASHSKATSFDCEKAVTTVEKMICSDSTLSELDNSLMQSYKKALASSGYSEAIKVEQ